MIPIAAAILLSAGAFAWVWKYKVGLDHQAADEAARAVDRLMTSNEHRRVVVTLHTGEGFDGVIVDVDSLTITLARASHLIDDQTQPVKVDGDLLIPRSDIHYLQRP